MPAGEVGHWVDLDGIRIRWLGTKSSATFPPTLAAPLGLFILRSTL